MKYRVGADLGCIAFDVQGDTEDEALRSARRQIRAVLYHAVTVLDEPQSGGQAKVLTIDGKSIVI